MHIRDGKPSTVIKGTVGSGGVAKGDLCMMSSNTFVKATGGASVLTICAIATKSAIATAVGSFELVGDRVISAKYTGVSKTSLTDADISKVFDVSDAQTVDLDDTSGGCCFCVDYDNDLDLIHFIVIPAQRTL
jgi:hypothetical protein